MVNKLGVISVLDYQMNKIFHSLQRLKANYQVIILELRCLKVIKHQDKVSLAQISTNMINGNDHLVDKKNLTKHSS